jgi:hypothetical protein
MIQISLRELVPLVAKEYAIITTQRGFKETLYIHPNSPFREYTSIDMSYYPKTKIKDVACKLTLLRLLIESILEMANGFVPQATLIKYMEQTIGQIEE